MSLFLGGSDFISFYQGAHRVASGDGAAVYREFLTVDPARHPYMFSYPAPTALLYAPLGFLSYDRAWALFEALSQAALLGAWWLLTLEARDRGIAEPVLRVTVLMGLFFPVYCSLWLGQCETTILFLLAAAMRLSRRGLWAPAGMAVAVAICLKAFLGLILVYFLLRRRWRLLLSAAAGLVALEAASLVAIPASAQVQYWSFAPIVTARLQPYLDNQAVSGIFFRLLSVNYYTRGIGRFDDWAQLLGWLAAAAVLLVYALVVAKRRDEDFGWGFSYTIVTGLLVFPLADTHHFLLLLFPFLFQGLVENRRAAWWWFYAFFALYVPLNLHAFLDHARYVYFADGFRTLIFSLPLAALLGLWLYMPAEA